MSLLDKILSNSASSVVASTPMPMSIVIKTDANASHIYTPKRDITAWEVAMVNQLFLISINSWANHVSQLSYIRQHGLGKHFLPEIV